MAISQSTWSLKTSLQVPTSTRSMSPPLSRMVAVLASAGLALKIGEMSYLRDNLALEKDKVMPPFMLVLDATLLRIIN